MTTQNPADLLPSIDDLDLSERGRRPCRVLLRVDYNVPFDAGRISDTHRISATLPTLRRLRDAGVTILIASHLGRPGGEFVDKLTLAPVAAELSRELGVDVRMAPGLVGPEVAEFVSGGWPGDVIMLENLRFDPGEEANSPEFSAALAGLADVYVNDGFGVSHRAHASTVGVASRLPGAAGLLCRREVEILGGLLTSPARPFVAVLGGAKVSDKIGVVSALLERVDTLIVGGGMCFSFLAADGIDVGDSLVEPDSFDVVRSAVAAANADRKEIYLPTDVVVADEFAANATSKVVGVGEIEPGWMGLDIGPETARRYAEVIARAGSVLWNGPMGVFEWPAFQSGTRVVAEAVAASDAFSVVGGGDSGAALVEFGLTDKVDHFSTGGGASLEFIELGDLPGLRALRDGPKGA